MHWNMVMGQFHSYNLLTTWAKFIIVFGKARVGPLKCMTMPRMELVAVTLPVNISALFKKEFQIPIKKEMFWTE